MYLNGQKERDYLPSRKFTEFLSKPGHDPKNFRGVCIKDLPHDFDVHEGNYVGELAHQSIGRFDKTFRLMQFNNHSFHTNRTESLFKFF